MKNQNVLSVNPSNSNTPSGTVLDPDHFTHTDSVKHPPNVIKIGNQIWSTHNLNVSNFRNGEPILEVQNSEDWIEANENHIPSWCYFLNNKTSYGKIFGKLYNWYAVNDPRGLAPQNFHIPSDNDWAELIEFLGGEALAGNKLKSKINWFGDQPGTNESGFSAFPGGVRYSIGGFNGIGCIGEYWSSTECDSENVFIYYIQNFQGVVQRDPDRKSRGLSVRCIRD